MEPVKIESHHDKLKEIQRLYAEVLKVYEKNMAAAEKVNEFMQRAKAMDIQCEQTYKRLDEHLEKWHSRLNRLTKAGALAIVVFAIAGGFAGTILAQAGTRFLDWVVAEIAAASWFR